MTTEDLYDLRFPIGEYQPPAHITSDQRQSWIADFESLPADLRAKVESLNDDQLSRPYRPDGWNGYQVIHHIADSHINSYMRFKLALTEANPTIRPYDEKIWAELPDGQQRDISLSLGIIENIHARMTAMFRNMSEADWKRTFFHPESETQVVLDWNLGMYAWHGRHHLAHLKLLDG